MNAQNEALELWRRLFEWTDNPYTVDRDTFDPDCFFCGNSHSMGHADDCIWLAAKKLVEASHD